ncbi:MAG TPA: radical SAM protein, partial [Candidatus Deferrimicrobium sp.]|nr:radical SAM protein [Candidatus Deferrimicrobium sp.]
SCQYKCAFCQMSNTRGAYRWIDAGEIKKYLAEFDAMGLESVGVAGTCVAKQDNLGDVFSWADQLTHVRPYIYGSLRVDDIRNVKEILPSVIYIAPETGNDYLRNKILLKTSKLKSIKEDIEYVLKETKVDSLVLCNIVGIPTESENDYEESIELLNWTAQLMGKMRQHGEISVSIDPLLPQPGTPYEEHGMIGPDTFAKIVDIFSQRIEAALPENVDFNIRHIDALDHLVEGIVNTGDRWTGDFFFDLYNNKTEWNIPDIINVYNEKINAIDSSDYLHRGDWQVKPWKMIDFGNSQYLEKAKTAIKKNIDDRKE